MFEPDVQQILKNQVAAHEYPMLFATVSGAHLYGFASADSDFDLRGAHILPAKEVVGLDEPKETITSSKFVAAVELDLVTHDIRKFFLLMLRPNGYVLEQLYSPYVIHTTPEHLELIEIASSCVTKNHVHHYDGFARSEWARFNKLPEPRLKPLLYVYRVLLTGIHLMRSGEVVADLPTLASEYNEKYILELVEAKRNGQERGGLPDADLESHRANCERLLERLHDEGEKSLLPELPSAHAQLSDLLVRLRLRSHL